MLISTFTYNALRYAISELDSDTICADLRYEWNKSEREGRMIVSLQLYPKSDLDEDEGLECARELTRLAKIMYVINTLGLWYDRSDTSIMDQSDNLDSEIGLFRDLLNTDDARELRRYLTQNAID